MHEQVEHETKDAYAYSYLLNGARRCKQTVSYLDTFFIPFIIPLLDRICKAGIIQRRQVLQLVDFGYPLHPPLLA